MKRAAANLAAALALLMAVAVPVLWVRSHRVAEGFFGAVPRGWYHAVVSAEGGIDVCVVKRYPWRDRFEWYTSDNYRRSRGPWYALGFAFRRDTISFIPHHTGPPIVPPAPSSMVQWVVRVPYWFLLALFAAFPAARARAIRRERVARRRLGKGLCVGCGYDVRATPDRCPECGTSVDRSSVTAS